MSDTALPRISVSTASTRANRTGSWKYIRPRYSDGVAPCNARCPTGVDVEGYMNLLRQDRVAEAIDLLLRENPIPAITGRVCHHPCEAACNRARLDEAVAVHLVERELGDRVLETRPVPPPRTRSERVAVVGSGPAGLACAYHLARLGYGVTVFEEADEAGGMLRLGIPPYRLPREVLDRQIAWLAGHGIEFRCGTRVAGDEGRGLLDGFDAVFLATGAHRGRALGAANEEGPGVIPGLEFLKAVNRGDRPAIGYRVVVVGGGNTAMDCARTALRLGAAPVVLYRRTRAEMPAIPAEVEEAEREGVHFEFLAAPRALHREGGRLVAVECDRMELGEPDASGRRRPVVSDGPGFTLHADLVLSAIGEEAELESLPATVAATGGSVRVDGMGGTGGGRVWAGGDLAGFDRTVSDALGSGKAAALGIDRALREKRGEPVQEAVRWAGGSFHMAAWRGDDPVRRTEPRDEVVDFGGMNPIHFQRLPRHREDGPPEVSGGGLEYEFLEVNRGLSAEDALSEARRCLNCAVCNDCELCLILCPDVAISRDGDGGGFSIDLAYCKGCGVCAAECPRGAIVMTREGL